MITAAKHFFSGRGIAVTGALLLQLAGIMLLLIAISARAQAATAMAPAASAHTLPALGGNWQLVADDSDDVVRLWHGAVRDHLKREARRVSSNSPMAQPANPGQHVGLPMFLSSYKTVRFKSTPGTVVIEQLQQLNPPKNGGADRIVREINLNPEATSISLREAARKPPTMFIGGWEKGALVIETTTDEGLIIEERWLIDHDDDEETLQRTVLLRSSIWGDKTFGQQFERVAK